MIIRIVALVFLFSLTACSQISYYAQATRGQLEIISKRQKISDILSDSDSEPKLAKSLKMANNIREFASTELGLPNNNTFRYYSDLERSHVVWNVVATPAYSLSPKTWCFFIAGCVTYKGYFSEDKAEQFNRSLTDRGFDTFLYGVSAYSTLGWFSDPILSTFINYNELSLAGLIFHELAHQVVYIKDDSEFNEAFATAVEAEGLKQWILQTHSEEVLASYQRNQKRNNEITEMILGFRDQLAAIYRDQVDHPDIEQEKQRVFQTMKEQYLQRKQRDENTSYYDWWFQLDLNNAHLASIATYHRLVPAFSRLIEESENLNDFYDRVRTLSRLEKKQRHAVLNVMPSSD